jgi:ribonuclease P protein component
MVMGGWLSGGTEAARCGVITSRKAGGAVERVRVRRRLRELFRLHRALLPSGLWLVVVARQAAATATFSSLAEEWRALARRAGYLKS